MFHHPLDLSESNVAGHDLASTLNVFLSRQINSFCPAVLDKEGGNQGWQGSWESVKGVCKWFKSKGEEGRSGICK